MLPHQARNPLFVHWHLLHEPQVGSDAGVAPEQVVSLERLNTQEHGGITLGYLERSAPRQPSRPSLFLA
jgi:hypothetical protein